MDQQQYSLVLDPLLQGNGQQSSHSHGIDDVGDIIADEQSRDEHLAVAVIDVEDAVDDAASRHLDFGTHLVGGHKGDFHAREESRAQ